MSGRTSGHQKLVLTYPWIDNCFMVTKSPEVDCLPCAVGKQPSIPLINLGKTWKLNWRWWWLCRLISYNTHLLTSSYNYIAFCNLFSFLILANFLNLNCPILLSHSFASYFTCSFLQWSFSIPLYPLLFRPVLSYITVLLCRILSFSILSYSALQWSFHILLYPVLLCPFLLSYITVILSTHIL